MQQEKKYGVLSSSENPQKLGDTVKGFIIGASVLIVYVAHQFLGVEVATESITQFAINAGAAVSALWVVFGVVKKIVIAITLKIKGTQ